jgi:predicted DNA-binding transcriptional regulator AlpA
MAKTAWHGKRWLSSQRVVARYGRHRSTIVRWLDDERLNFPKPTWIRGRNYWDEDELDRWDQACAAGDHSAERAAQREKLKRKGEPEGAQQP